MAAIRSWTHKGNNLGTFLMSMFPWGLPQYWPLENNNNKSFLCQSVGLSTSQMNLWHTSEISACLRCGKYQFVFDRRTWDDCIDAVHMKSVSLFVCLFDVNCRSTNLLFLLWTNFCPQIFSRICATSKWHFTQEKELSRLDFNGVKMISRELNWKILIALKIVDSTMLSMPGVPAVSTDGTGKKMSKIRRIFTYSCLPAFCFCSTLHPAREKTPPLMWPQQHSVNNKSEHKDNQSVRFF